MNKKLSTIIWVIATFAILVAAYIFYSKNKPQSFTPPKVNQTESNSKAIADNKLIAPDFRLKDLNGKDVKLSEYRGKVVILNFWAVWCKFCIQEMPDLNELNKELVKGNEAVILAVNVQESSDTVREYLSKGHINLNVLMDQDGSVTEDYGVTGFPTTFIINKDGTIYTYIPGATNKETLNEILSKVKKGEPAQ